MSDLNRILLIDDDAALAEELLPSFAADGVELVLCQTKDGAIKEIDSGKKFDLILLDWYLEQEDDSSLSRLVLSHLRKHSFIPVFVWSNHIPDFIRAVDGREVLYPKGMIHDISKAEFTAATVKDRINQMYSESTAARISAVYREAVHRELESVFFDLAEVPEGDISIVLRSVVGDDENFDWSSDFILSLVHRKLITDRRFTARLSELIRLTSSEAIPRDEAARQFITNRIMYYRPDSATIRCGDIITIVAEGSSKYGVVCTPDCDIAQPNTRFLEVIELRPIDDGELRLSGDNKDRIRKYSHGSFYFFPSIHTGARFEDYVAVLKSKGVLEEALPENQKPYPQASRRLQFTDQFRHKGVEVNVALVCSLSNPYKSDFLHALHSHNARVGTPDIKELWLTRR